MDTLITLGATETELQELHDFVTKYTREKETRELANAKNLELIRDQIRSIGVPYQALWDKMEKDERKSLPVDDQSFIVVEKFHDRIRMAETTDSDKSLQGYLPNFDNVSAWQEVSVDNRVDGGAVVRSIFHFNKAQIDMFSRGEETYLGASTEVRINGLKKVTPDDLVQTFTNANTLMKVPQSLLD